MDILRIEKLQKSYGSNHVLRGLDLTVPEHSVFGFVGQNGAGKTTTMKTVLGLTKADAGRIYVCGERVRFGETKTNRFVGYLPDVPEFYPFMNAPEYLRLCGRVAGMEAEDIKGRSAELLDLVGLAGNKKRVGGYSRGMKQRLGIAQALLHQPKLLICDEPTSALDPVGRKEILDILLSVRGRTTVLFSTHILSDVERICDRIAVLHDGTIRLSGTLPELKARHRSGGLALEFADTAARDRVGALLPAALGEARPEGTRGLLVRSANLEPAQKALMELMVRENILPLGMEVEEASMESLFLEVVS
jgi:ABC-2 type transport system ATP-binding protein